MCFLKERARNENPSNFNTPLAREPILSPTPQTQWTWRVTLSGSPCSCALLPQPQVLTILPAGGLERRTGGELTSHGSAAGDRSQRCLSGTSCLSLP
ncbi:hypothetical protein D4764_20G0006820 [Takifugu flavidus]|uniref:Uncharacterized protein n=1 Tax=Takifugu flavidus TaxID=433684 RepID=A0A5C6NKN6_9TELE|nr:hypothetical protein D4764_20G0006820 [Takifugu flavidus]